MMKTGRTFYFCPVCGENRRAYKAGQAFALVSRPYCSECNCPLQLSGRYLILVGLLISLPFMVVDPDEVALVGLGIFLSFTTVALMRIGRQYLAKRKFAAHQALPAVGAGAPQHNS